MHFKVTHSTDKTERSCEIIINKQNSSCRVKVEELTWRREGKAPEYKAHLQKSIIKAHFHKPLKSPEEEEVKYQRAITVSSKREIPSITVKSNHRDM